MGTPTKYTLKAGCLSFVSNYIEESVPFKNIKYIQAKDKVCYVYIKEFDPFETYIPLTKLYEQLPKDLFIKANRSCVISLAEIQSVNSESVTLNDGTQIPIVAKNHDDIVKRHREYLFFNSNNNKKIQIQKEIDKYHLLDTSPVPWCVTEMIYEKGVPVDFRFQYVNDAVVDLLELDSKDQLLGKSSREAFQSVNEVWIDFYALISINGISSNNVIKSSVTGKDIYVRSYRTVYGYVASIMQDIKVIKPVIENVG